MINLAFGLGQNQQGLIYYKFNVMPAIHITPTPTPTITLPGGGGHSSPGEPDLDHWRTFKFNSHFRGYKEEHTYHVKFPIPEFKLINITIKDKRK